MGRRNILRIEQINFNSKYFALNQTTLTFAVCSRMQHRL